MICSQKIKLNTNEIKAFPDSSKFQELKFSTEILFGYLGNFSILQFNISKVIGPFFWMQSESICHTVSEKTSLNVNYEIWLRNGETLDINLTMIFPFVIFSVRPIKLY